MTDRKQRLAALADRVEGLTGPDREVDAEIAHAIHWRWEGWDEGDLCIEERPLEYVVDRMRNSHNSIWRYLPAYTASLDAAMTLVRAGYGFQVDGFGDAWWSSLSEEEGFNSNARTPALSLCAAALRAQSETVA